MSETLDSLNAVTAHQSLSGDLNKTCLLDARNNAQSESMIRPRTEPRRRPRPDLINRIGFFHFGRNANDPIESLRASLIAATTTLGETNLSNCLIGLPEAFNIRGGYWNANRRVDSTVLDLLAGLSLEFGVAFVVGLLEQFNTQRLPYSSAYLIDASTCTLLSRKMENDGSGNYQPCHQNYDQPLSYRGICLAALLCMDANFEKHRVSDRHSELLARMKAMGNYQQVLIIPAHMTTFTSEEFVKAWPPHVVTVLANSAAGHPSVIQVREQLVRIKPEENQQNVVYVTAFR